MHLPNLLVVLALLVALSPAALIGWAIGAALDRHVHAPGHTSARARNRHRTAAPLATRLSARSRHAGRWR
jgi:hypothetical protein